MRREHIEDLIAKEVEQIIEGTGLELVDVEYVRERNWYLRVFIDKEGGVGIQDCENISRAVDPLLDQLDALKDAYRFEVSSPGLGRKIQTDAQMNRYLNQSVCVHLIRPEESGERDFTGLLMEYDKQHVLLRTEEGEQTISRSNIAHIKADDDDISIGGK